MSTITVAPAVTSTETATEPVLADKKFGTPLHIRDHIRTLWETVKRELISHAPRPIADYYADGPAPTATAETAEATETTTEATAATEAVESAETAETKTTEITESAPAPTAKEDEWVDTRATTGPTD